MNDPHPHDHWIPEDTPLPVIHTVEAAEAIREATYRMQRMQLAREEPQRLDLRSLAAVGAAFEDITRGLAQLAGQVAGSLPDTLEHQHTASQDIRNGLIAFRIAVLDASVAARSLGLSATSINHNGSVPRQRRE
jgi:hypothetical protein